MGSDLLTISGLDFYSAKESKRGAGLVRTHWKNSGKDKIGFEYEGSNPLAPTMERETVL